MFVLRQRQMCIRDRYRSCTDGLGQPVGKRPHVMQRFDELDSVSLKSDIPAFRAGDTVNVHVKVVEGTRSRIQVFKGVVIRRHGGGIGETFTVRKVSFGVGVERTFPPVSYTHLTLPTSDLV